MKIAVIATVLLSIIAVYADGVWGYTYCQQVGSFMPTGVTVRAECTLGNTIPFYNYKDPPTSDTTKYLIEGWLVQGWYYYCIHAWITDEWDGHNYNGFTWGGGEIQRNVVLQIMP